MTTLQDYELKLNEVETQIIELLESWETQRSTKVVLLKDKTYALRAKVKHEAKKEHTNLQHKKERGTKFPIFLNTENIIKWPKLNQRTQ